MKKRFLIGLAVFAVIGAALVVILYHSADWFRDDPLEYIKDNCRPDGQTIVSGEYVATGMDKQGGYVIYRVTTEHGDIRYIRLHVVFHRHLTRIGPEYRIRGLTELEHYESLEEQK